MQRPLSDTDLGETVLLIKCLIVMCRHFDNISTIANYEYISSTVSIAINIVKAVSQNKYQTTFAGSIPTCFSLSFPLFSKQIFKDKRKPTQTEIDYIQSFSQLIEVIYDPYLAWRNFLRGNFADQKRVSQNVVQLHVELVPFIYGNVDLMAPEGNTIR